MNAKQKEIQEARESLLEILNPGDTVYTVLKHVSRSGMYRVIDLYVMKDNEPHRISWTAAKLLEGYDRNHEGCKAGGCGMDMGFHLVYNLGHMLWPNGTDKPHGTRNGEPDSSGGYALKQRWM